MKLILKHLASLLIIVMLACQQNNSNSQLEANFKNPPSSAKPKTWMHAMIGNMTKEGLTKDFESMAKVGIGGVLLFNIAQGIPNGPVKYNSDEHHDFYKADDPLMPSGLLGPVSIKGKNTVAFKVE